MTGQRHFSMTCNASDLEEINSKIEAFAETSNWSPKLLINVQLVIEELILNIFNYGGENLQARLDIDSDSHGIALRLEDNGKPFNPLLDSPEPDIDASLEDRRIGGLGVYLVKQLAEDIVYRREGVHNILTMKMSAV